MSFTVKTLQKNVKLVNSMSNRTASVAQKKLGLGYNRITHINESKPTNQFLIIFPEYTIFLIFVTMHSSKDQLNLAEDKTQTGKRQL